MKRWLVLIPLLVVALSACVPSVQAGSSADNPILIKEDSVVRVAPGTTVYLRGRFSGDPFGVTSEMNRSMFNRQVVQRPFVGQVLRVSWQGFVGSEPKAPAGWELSLVNAQSFQEVTRIDQSTVYYQQGLELTFSVRVPANAPSGSHTVALTVSREGYRVPIPLNLSVPSLLVSQ